MSEKDSYIEYPSQKRRGKIANNLMWSITLFAIILMIIASIKSIEKNYYHIILLVEFIISCIFFVDYLIRWHLSGWKFSFIKNIFNIFDLIVSLPFILAFGLKGYLVLDYLKILRVIRILRVFRLGKYFSFLTNLGKALKKYSYKYKIAGAFFLICWIIASFAMYAVEGSVNPGFVDIPNSMWWSLVTMSTVGYGDVYPITVLGKIVGGVVIVLGPIFLAIISSISIITFLDVMKLINKDTIQNLICESCRKTDHETEAKYCCVCGKKLSSTSHSNNYILDNY